MQITLNGQIQNIENSQTVAELLEELQVAHKKTVVERNGIIVMEELHKEEGLKDGDRIEIIHFVGGG
ncbi:thiamine biosynthesis protein ThiS [Marinococcus halophilus]|uniref:Sulfur carrier protein ThiS n=1 Tax=Marinococcus halophilus TaxID=1371 RepID=A0A510Y4S3_MARHA|nr:sulfur carrier protein ThiS [Marinococcus halophilus]OZT81592.1 thiamine biosynthesis protein ThiS [Marinococcus halophilus]GEK57537.1 sulfur carrier protein ThiS [Marinococcus halophilus]